MMMEETEKIEKKAYAKVNLYLKILGKTANNYHRLFTVMHTIPVHDTLHINIRREKNNASGASVIIPKIICSDAEIPAGRENTVYKAIQLYFSHISNITKIIEDAESYAIDVSIEKRIPSQAGLGGGSSDAAAVLLALNEYFGKTHRKTVEENALVDIAAKVGADVPFFVKTREKASATAICEGIGEIVTPICTKCEFDKLRFEIIKPECNISTKEAFALYDDIHGRSGIEYNGYCGYEEYDGYTKRITEVFKNGGIKDIADIMHNDFEDVANLMCNDIKAAKSELLDGGAAAAQLSGSGSAVFGIFT